MLASAALLEAQEALATAGVLSAKAESEILLAHVLKISRGQVLAKLITEPDLEVDEGFGVLIERRCTRVPLQHILGTAPFRSLELAVGPGVFIPRPETEQVAQIAIDFLNLLPGESKALDIGTGSGAIAIAIAAETNTVVTAIEISKEAAVFTAENISNLNANVTLIVADFLEVIGALPEFDLVISNPPYIPNDMVPIDPEVRDHDPALALYGGEDGLDIIRDLATGVKLVLRDGGLFVLEHADGQSDAICELLLENNWRSIQVHPDPTGRLRAVSATR
ncbi:MAG: peptide chain release factor N(5)-glutamine methyltransferase [Aquiluna sp.]|nr:peptide chain release factor N(5)-glutamine methyltransferase [Aquiluna sp.]